MKSGRLTVVVRIKAQQGLEGTVRGVLLALITPATREKGCITYALHQSADDPGLFMYYENWGHREDLLAQPHVQALLVNVAPMLAAPVDISFWHMID